MYPNVSAEARAAMVWHSQRSILEDKLNFVTPDGVEWNKIKTEIHRLDTDYMSSQGIKIAQHQLTDFQIYLHERDARVLELSYAQPDGAEWDRIKLEIRRLDDVALAKIRSEKM